VARVAWECGIRTVRLTGGEPLIRPGLDDLVARLSAIGFDDIALTTNGMLLPRLADRMAHAGLQRVNISCDSLRSERFALMRRRGRLDVVLEAMTAAERAGLFPIKVNVVLIEGRNDDEILDFAEFGRATGRTVRFIEFMPLDADRTWERSRVVPGQQVLDEIGARWPIEEVSQPGGAPGAPAERFRYLDGGGEVGIIRSVTAPFCATCDRLRLTAEGALRNCLFSDDEVTLKHLLRGKGTDADLTDALYCSVGAKRAGHGIDDPAFVAPKRSMSMIGG
jgi:cyclic pyranopterin phosphate synthase